MFWVKSLDFRLCLDKLMMFERTCRVGIGRNLEENPKGVGELRQFVR